jgi:hypothetical protein
MFAIHRNYSVEDLTCIDTFAVSFKEFAAKQNGTVKTNVYDLLKGEGTLSFIFRTKDDATRFAAQFDATPVLVYEVFPDSIILKAPQFTAEMLAEKTGEDLANVRQAIQTLNRRGWSAFCDPVVLDEWIVCTIKTLSRNTKEHGAKSAIAA